MRGKIVQDERTPSRGEKFVFLEGARGLAALQVFFTHYASAFLATFARHGADAVPHYLWESRLAWSPLFFLVDGGFAVDLFFVLSGFVLAKSFLAPELSIPRQILKRYLRLNIPSALATLVAFGFLLRFPLARAHVIPLVASPWLTWLYPLPMTFPQLIPEMLGSIIFGYREYSLFSGFSWIHPLVDPLSISSNIPPLWTLHVELWGSLLVLGLARFYRSVPAPVFYGGVLLLLYFLGPSQFGLFIAGFVSYLFRARLIAQSPGASLGGFCAIGLGIWMTTLVPPTNGYYVVCQQFAAIPFFLGILLSSQVRALTSTRPIAWLGKISFSLYLVHFPILFSVAFSIFVALRGYCSYGVTVFLTTVLGLAVTLVVAALFERFVDLPAVSFSRAASKFRQSLTRGATHTAGWIPKAGPILNRGVMVRNNSASHLFSPLPWVLFSSVVLTLLLWLPFGFDMGGLIEDWGFLSSFDQYGVFFACDAQGPLPTMQMRPLMIFPYALAYAGEPNSFLLNHLLLMTEIGLKCFAFSAIVWVLTRSRRLALFAGLLLVLYPADTMQLCFRTLSINWPLATILLGSACLLYALECPGTKAKAILTFLAGFMVIISVLMYEAAIVLLLLPFLIWYIREGFRSTCRVAWNQRGVILGWILSFVACGVYEIYIATHHRIYEGSLSDPPIDIVSHFPLIFSIGFVRSLTGGWFDAFGILIGEVHNYSYLILMTAALLGLLYRGKSRPRLAPSAEPEHFEGAFIARLIGCGLLLIFLGYLPTLPSYAHLLITQRTYLFSSPGACLVWLGIIMALLNERRSLAMIVATLLLLAGAAAQLFQFNHYNRIWYAQQKILKSIVESVPSIPPGKFLLIIDASGQLNATWMFGDDIGSAISYFYHHPVPTEVCIQPGNDWVNLDAYGRCGQCIETPTSWEFMRRPGFDPTGAITGVPSLAVQIPKQKLVIVKIEADGSVIPDGSESAVLASINGDPVRRARYLNLLAPAPWPLGFGLFPAPSRPSTYRWDFGRWWNLDLPTQGSGWRESEWAVNYYHHVSFAWKIEPVSTLLFKLYPEQKSYLIEGKCVAFAAPIRKEDLKIQLNGQDVPLVWEDDLTFRGEPSPASLKSGMNELEFVSPPNDKYYGLSTALDWVSVHPK